MNRQDWQSAPDRWPWRRFITASDHLTVQAGGPIVIPNGLW
jgi:hypothetical protein